MDPSADASPGDRNPSPVDDDVDDLFASPTTLPSTANPTTSSTAPARATRDETRARALSEASARETRLRAELERVREVNRVVCGVTTSLSKARGDMETVRGTVGAASTLLATWTRILSQTEHNQRLVLNANWKGASRDLDEMESEEVRRQQEAERRALEEERRREEAQRRAEEEERRRLTAAEAPRGKVGVVRGVRGTRSSSRGYAGTGRGRGATGATGSGAPSRAGSGIGRTPSTRGRGRGLG